MCEVEGVWCKIRSGEGDDKEEEKHEEHRGTKNRPFWNITPTKTLVSPFNRLRDSCQACLFDRLSMESTAEEQRKREKEG